MSTNQKDNKKEPNDIRIGMNSRPRNVIKYSTSVMDEKKLKELKFSAVGGSIGRLLDIVEVLKVLKPGLYQQNRITSVAYQTVDSNNTLLNQRLYPKLEVILSTEEPKNKTEGYQGQLDEEIRKQIEKAMNEKKERVEKNRGRGTGRGRGRGGPRGRGRRGGFRGRRGGFRGRPRRGDSRPRRGDTRRGRGNRGTPRGRGGRGANRGNRGRGGNDKK
jgi:mRNA-degrading endonuclease RelE of RelBE toxin-antitoxin system